MELANLEPSMRDLQHQLRLARREFAKQSRIAEAKRMQLEVHLSSALKVDCLSSQFPGTPTDPWDMSFCPLQGIKAQLALDDWGSMFSDPTPEESRPSTQPIEAEPSATEPTTVRSSGQDLNKSQSRRGSIIQSMASYVSKGSAGNIKLDRDPGPGEESKKKVATSSRPGNHAALGAPNAESTVSS
jgi:hypothetical protein